MLDDMPDRTIGARYTARIDAREIQIEGHEGIRSSKAIAFSTVSVHVFWDELSLSFWPDPVPYPEIGVNNSGFHSIKAFKPTNEERHLGVRTSTVWEEMNYHQRCVPT